MGRIYRGGGELLSSRHFLMLHLAVRESLVWVKSVGVSSRSCSLLLHLAVSQSLEDVEQQVFGQGLELGQPRHLVIVFDAHV